MRHQLLYRALLCAAVLTLSACTEEEKSSQSPPPPKVEIITARAQTVPNVLELPGRVQAVRVAEIRARVDGIIQRRLYEEGTHVEAGTVLFQIDPREMQANLRAAQATLERAEATAVNAAQDVKRYKGLVAKQAISQQEYDTAQARLRTARADVSEAQAAVESAELDLGYTRVTAPIAGRAGRAQVTEGALVTAANGTLLATVEQYDTVFVNFSQSSSDVLALRAQVASGELKLPSEGRVAVKLILEDGSEYPHTGYIDFLAMTIDVSTGTAALRAKVPNPDLLLLPGQFVRARIDAGVRPNGFLIPQRAVMISDSDARVLLVGEDGLVTSRDIELGDLLGSNWAVRDGLRTGDRIIVEGGQNARDGQPVRTVPYSGPEGDTPPTEASQQ